MSSNQGILSSWLANRVRAILLRPNDEWRVIDTEKTDIATIYRSYAIPLAAIGPIANLIGSALVGTGVGLAGVVRVPLSQALIGAVVSFAVSLAGVYVVALVADNLAPNNGGTRNMTQAFKVAAYSSTAQWLAGIFAILPALRGLSILGLYSAYLLYLGLPLLMKVPREKAMSYTVTVVVVSIVVFIVIAAVSAAVVGFAYVY